MNPYAAIDLGTNTARLLIGTLSGEGAIEPILVQREIIRLGGGFCRERGISPGAWARALQALSGFSAQLRAHRVSSLRAVATSAVRDAANGRQFCAAVRESTGIGLEVIDGNMEALMTLQGVRAGIKTERPHLFLFDVGGGSTEYTVASGSTPLFTESLPLGVVRLTEGKVRCGAMEEKIERELAGLRQRMDQAGVASCLEDAELVGTAGTATTLAAISMEMDDYDYRRVNNCKLTRGEIEDIFRLLLPLSPGERLRIKGLEPGREDLIIAGTLLTLRTMYLFGFDRMKVSDFGLLEGVFLSMARR